MNQENFINPSLLEEFERYFKHSLSDTEARDFEKRLSVENDLKHAYEAYLLSRDAINEKIEIGLRKELKEWQSIKSSKPKTRIFTLYRWRAAVAACTLGFVCLSVFQNYKLNNFIDEKIETGLDLYAATRGEAQTKVEKIISANSKDKLKLLSELAQIPVLDPEYGKAQKYLGNNAISNGDCENAKKYLNNVKASQDDLSLAVILCHLKSNEYDEEFETELKSILSDPQNNNYKIGLDIKNKMSSIWWKLLK